MSKKIAVHFAPVDSSTLYYMEVEDNYVETLQLTEDCLAYGHLNAYWIDAEQILAVEDTLKKAIDTAIVCMLDCLRARYEDGVHSGYEDMTTKDYVSWLSPFIKNMRDIVRHPKRTTVQEWIDG
jgi:hypothetical protein